MSIIKCQTVRVVCVIGMASLCWANSDPYLYLNKTQKPQDGSPAFHFNLSNVVDQSDNQRENDQYLTARDFENALSIDMAALSARRDLDNSDLFEGDISSVRTSKELRNAIVGQHFRWPKAIIPYVITTSFTMSERSVIARAIMEYHNKTCIRFVPRTNQPDYIIFKTTGSGCNSNVGRTGGSQVVSLDQGCVHVGLIIHELMHAAGFFHEQARADRDNYVVVNWANIQEGNQRNFDKLSLNEIEYLGTQYDTSSVMHYDQYSFAKDRSIPTIYSKTGGPLGNTEGFSLNDVIKINRMYQCDSTVVTTAKTTTTTATTTKPVTLSSSKATDYSRRTEPTTTESTWIDPTTTTKANTGSECVDTMSDCQLWADDGFCSNSVDLMTSFCKKTCRFCSTHVQPCVDLNPACSIWASNNQCMASPVFMAVKCPKSCQTCSN